MISFSSIHRMHIHQNEVYDCQTNNNANTKPSPINLLIRTSKTIKLPKHIFQMTAQSAQCLLRVRKVRKYCTRTQVIVISNLLAMQTEVGRTQLCSEYASNMPSFQTGCLP